jgi:hypothetical protein
MAIIINLSRVCKELRPVIVSILYGRIAKDNVIEDNADEGQICILAEEDDKKKITLIIESEFTQNRDFDDYVITGNNDNPAEIDILKKGDLEQLGLFICSFCPMICQSEVEKIIHQRIHYFGFG